ncbi:glycosyl hydrolase [Cellulomonas alba]|uniref:glucan endo-1,3-beta-D-glucosidase n=1 Tax=Cellulomonas alba TaxID=3053467 RepID=A0ABT7SEU2_9CELL|nr:glycosyl hydrolase [Cellulomonas alba]MDM7854711.1 glycosyl hydrolase [Cellulomonas alba]
MTRNRSLPTTLMTTAAAAVTALALAACGPQGDAATGATGSAPHTGPVQGPKSATPPTVDTAALVAGVTHKDATKLGRSRLAPGVLPPTDRWYSGLAFGDAPQPVFAEPLSFALTGSGFTLGLPQPVPTEKTIAGPHVPAVTVAVAGAASSRIAAADPVGVTVDLLDGSGTVLGTVGLAEGTPYVTFTAKRGVDVTSTAQGGTFAAGAGGSGAGAAGAGGPDATAGAAAADGATASATVAGRTWGLVAPGSGSHAGSTHLDAGATAGWYALPDGAKPPAAKALAAAARHPVTGVDVSYGVDRDVARTTLGYRTDGPGAYVLMPHHRTGDQPKRTGCALGTYPSIYGDLELCAGRTLTAFAPTLAATGAFDLDGVPASRVAAIRAALVKDVAATKPFPTDTYFGGKALYRAATLVTLGEQLGLTQQVAKLRTTTEQALDRWTEPKGCTQRPVECVVYDAGAHSALGLEASFGSDQLNDHHFHDGYLLSAAGLLADGHADLAKRWAPVMNLLAQDVAAAQPSEQLPQLRMVDPYAGHSWASGTAPFADGNNQESSSEAVNAWNGLGLWAAASGQAALGTEASWLASNEALAARTYWTDTALPDGFGHQVVSLNWGGKRDYATWFSPDPNAILAIQLIPMGPVQRYLAGDPARIRAQVHEATPGGTSVQFGGYLLGYAALAGKADAAKAWTQALSLPDSAVDDGSSHAATLAFVAAAQAHPAS